MKYSICVIEKIDLDTNGSAVVLLNREGLPSAAIALGAIYDGRLDKLSLLSETGRCKIVFESGGFMYILLDGKCCNYKLNGTAAETLYRLMTDHALGLTFPENHVDITALSDDSIRCVLTFRISYPALASST